MGALQVTNRSWDHATHSGRWRVSPTPWRSWTEMTVGQLKKTDEGARVIGARVAACYQIHTKAVEIGGLEKVRRKTSLMEFVNLLCIQKVGIHVWVTEFLLVLLENNILAMLGYDIEVPGIWQWSLLWFLAPLKEASDKPVVKTRTLCDICLSPVKENWHTLSVDADSCGEKICGGNLDGWALAMSSCGTIVRRIGRRNLWTLQP